MGTQETQRKWTFQLGYYRMRLKKILIWKVEIRLNFQACCFILYKYQMTKDTVKGGKEGWETTTLGVCWNLIGHEGNISSVAAGLPVTVNKAARINKSKISKDHSKIKTFFFPFYKICHLIPSFMQLYG